MVHPEGGTQGPGFPASQEAYHGSMSDKSPYVAFGTA